MTDTKIIDQALAYYKTQGIFSQNDDFDMDLDFEDNFNDDLYAEEPTDEQIQMLEKNNTPKEKDALSLGVSKDKRKLIPKISYAFYALRKKVYAYNEEVKSPLISGDSPFVSCKHCGKEHIVSTLILKGEEDKHSDAIYSLLNLYDFAYKCSCGKYIYGYFKEPDTTEFENMLSEIFSTSKKSSKKTKTPKKAVPTSVQFGEQLSLFDIISDTESSNGDSNETIISTVEVSMENVPPTLTEKMSAVSQLNSELDILCDKIYTNPEYKATIDNFSTFKMKELINEAKRRDGVKNFMRMLKKEIISCLIMYDQSLPELTPLLDKVQERTAWLYGKYKDIV